MDRDSFLINFKVPNHSLLTFSKELEDIKIENYKCNIINVNVNINKMSTYTKQNLNSKYIPPQKRKQQINEHKRLNIECIESMEIEKQQLVLQLEMIPIKVSDVNQQNSDIAEQTLLECDKKISYIDNILENAMIDKLNTEKKICTMNDILSKNTRHMQNINVFLFQSQNYLSTKPFPISLDDQQYIFHLKKSINNAIHDKDMYIAHCIDNNNHLNEHRKILKYIDDSIELYKNDVKNINVYKTNSINFYKEMKIQYKNIEQNEITFYQDKINWLDSQINILKLDKIVI